jgi:hypothetical protein
MSDYSHQFYRKLKSEPLKQTARLVDFQWRAFLRRRELAPFRRQMTSARDVPSILQPPPHYYIDYRGPWIEDVFYKHWAMERPKSEVHYLPIFWTDFYQWAQTQRYSPRMFDRINSEIRRILDAIAQSDRAYFTLLEYDHTIWDWHLFPENVVVYSAGGNGDVPIPLLKGSPPYEEPVVRDIEVSFLGRLNTEGHGGSGTVRQRMHAAMKDVAYFGLSPDWRDIMRRSEFSLCPRGLGRTSFRLYEAMSVGSIPIYIWDDVEWLPWQDELDWSEFAISVPASEVGTLPERIAALSAAERTRMRSRLRDLYDDYFTLEGTCRQIVKRVTRMSSPDDVRRLTAERHAPRRVPC